MEKNEMDRVKQRYTELANMLGELSGGLDSLKKTIHKLEGLAALIDLQIEAMNPKHDKTNSFRLFSITCSPIQRK